MRRRLETPAIDLAAERRQNAAEMVAQARWLFEMHERRDQSAQTRASVMLGFTGTLLTLALRPLPAGSSHLREALAIAVVAFGILTVILAVAALFPRAKKRGSPDVMQLRASAVNLLTPVEQRKTPRPPIPVEEHMADLLYPDDVCVPGPVDGLRDMANGRIRLLRWAYLSLGLTIVAIAIQFVTHP